MCLPGISFSCTHHIRFASVEYIFSWFDFFLYCIYFCIFIILLFFFAPIHFPFFVCCFVEYVVMFLFIFVTDNLHTGNIEPLNVKYKWIINRSTFDDNKKKNEQKPHIQHFGQSDDLSNSIDRNYTYKFEPLFDFSNCHTMKVREDKCSTMAAATKQQKTKMLNFWLSSVKLMNTVHSWFLSLVQSLI